MSKPDELKNDSGSATQVPSGVTTEKEAEQATELAQMRAMLLSMQNTIGQLEKAADSNALEAVRRAEGSRPDYVEVTLPSLDGKDPIINVVSSGTVYLDAFENVVDTQTREYTTLSGKVGKEPYQALMTQIQNHPIVSRTNNLEVTFDADGFRRLRSVKPDFLVNVTVKNPETGAFDGLTLDIPYRLLNWSK